MTHLLGIEDEEFIRGQVPMTKQEIRVLTLTKAKIHPADFILDIGAGTGSLSIEAALLAPLGQVYAVERKAEGIDLIKQNMMKFGAHNISVIEGEAPDDLGDLPRFDVILIGGSGKKLMEIFQAADRLLKPAGRLIINCVTVETLSDSLEILAKQANYTYDAMQAQIARLQKVGQYHMYQAINPIHIITAVKGDL